MLLWGSDAGGAPAKAETQCPFCSVQCKMTVTPGEKGVPGQHRTAYKVEGVPNAASEGRVCVKGMNAHQHAVHSQRLLHPLVRSNGELVPCSWEEAIEMISRRFQTISEQYGPDANAV